MKRYLKSLLLLAIMLFPSFAIAEQSKSSKDYAAIVNPFIGTHRAKRISLMGTLSAWYVLAASGVYPFVPGVGAMMLNTPRYSKITWHAPKGDIVFSKSSDARYTTDCKVNGKRHDSTWLDWSLVQNGGTIEHKTADTPKSWGTNQLPPSLRK